MFDIEFNLGLVFVGVLTTLIIWDRIEKFTVDVHTMQPPKDVDLSDTDSDKDSDSEEED